MICFFFFNDTATTEIYTLSLHDALPIFFRDLVGDAGQHLLRRRRVRLVGQAADSFAERIVAHGADEGRSEEHTSELQSRQYLVCRLLLEKKKTYMLTLTLI